MSSIYRGNLNVMLSDLFTDSDIRMSLFCGEDRLKVIGWDTLGLEHEAVQQFLKRFSEWVQDVAVDELIYNDLHFYEDKFGVEDALICYALSQKIVYSYFNRFFT